MVARMLTDRIITAADLDLARSAPAPVDEVLPGDEQAPRQARRLLDALEGCCLPPERMNDVLVVVSEAVTNAVLHGYPPGEAGPIHLKAWALDNALAVLIRDEGCGFDPGSAFRAPRSGLGLGLSLMRAVATELRVVSRPGGGATVFMIFRP